MVDKKVTIKISKRLHKFLTIQGLKSESYDDIIWRLFGQKALTKEQSKEIKSKYESSL
tara:strand:+ start:10276 stop:10449 length:174 start_codon:yes stop_codon:yes gene_type:complete